MRVGRAICVEAPQMVLMRQQKSLVRISIVHTWEKIASEWRLIMRQRILAGVLAVLMCMSNFPVSAYAAEATQSTEQVTTQEVTTQEATTEQTTPEQTTPEQTTTEEVTTEEAITEEVTTEQATTEEVTTEETTEETTTEQNYTEAAGGHTGSYA